MYMHYNHCHRATAHLNYYYYYYYYYKSVKRVSSSHLIVTGINSFSHTELSMCLFNNPPEDEIGSTLPNAVSCSEYWTIDKSINLVIIGS